MPRAGRFVSAFGSQSIPDDAGILVALAGVEPWPEVDLERLATVLAELGGEADVLLRRFPPGDRADAAVWAEATRRHQAALLRIQVEALRLRKYRPAGGFALDRLLDGAPAVSGALLDYHRRPKPAYDAVAAACAPTIVVADPPLEAVAPRSTVRTRVAVIHDGRLPVDACRVDAHFSVAGLSVDGETHPAITRSWGGALAADSVTHIGSLELDLGDATGAVVLDLSLSCDGPDGPVELANRYRGHIGAG